MTGTLGTSARARSFALVQHVPDEGPGLVAHAARRAGVDLLRVRAWAGDPLPALSEVDGVVVLGGPMAASDDDGHPCLKRERDLLAAAVAAGKPVLGICLGAQLIAAALGARLRLRAVDEIGPTEVRLTEEGAADPVVGGGAPEPGTLPVLQWHTDTFELPPGAVLLASSDACAHQAFRVGERAYGLQFHVEIDPSLVAKLPGEATPTAAEVDRIERAGQAILDRFFACA
ncbi:MAG: type 1 glutamine amidotransferase [Frankiaceae bacterium]